MSVGKWARVGIGERGRLRPEIRKAALKWATRPFGERLIEGVAGRRTVRVALLRITRSGGGEGGGEIRDGKTMLAVRSGRVGTNRRDLPSPDLSGFGREY